MDLLTVAQVLDSEVAKRNALVEASAALKQIGSLTNAVSEVQAVHANVTAQVEAKRGALADIEADIKKAEGWAEEHVTSVKNWAEAHAVEARDQAKEIVDLARAEAAKVWAEFNEKVARAEAALEADIDALKNDKATAEADAAAAKAELAKWEAKVVDAQKRLDAIKQVASKLAA